MTDYLFWVEDYLTCPGFYITFTCFLSSFIQLIHFLLTMYLGLGI